MDGELDSIDVAETITQVKKTEELRNEWSTYHLIGDALRQPEMATFDITSGIRKRLAIEPTVLTQELSKEKKGKVFAFAVAASMLTAVAAVSWMGGQTMDQPFDRVTDTAVLQTAVKTEFTEPTVITVPVLAQKEEFKTGKLFLQAQAAAQADSDVIPNSAPIQLNDYMFAHEEFSPRTAIRGVSSYMHTVADPYKGPVNR